LTVIKDISEMVFFICNAYVYVPKERRGRLDVKAVPCCSAGHCEGIKCTDPMKHMGSG
jgi:hypothetical protein